MYFTTLSRAADFKYFDYWLNFTDVDTLAESLATKAQKHHKGKLPILPHSFRCSSSQMSSNLNILYREIVVQSYLFYESLLPSLNNPLQFVVDPRVLISFQEKKCLLTKYYSLDPLIIWYCFYDSGCFSRNSAKTAKGFISKVLDLGKADLSSTKSSSTSSKREYLPYIPLYKMDSHEISSPMCSFHSFFSSSLPHISSSVFSSPSLTNRLYCRPLHSPPSKIPQYSHIHTHGLRSVPHSIPASPRERSSPLSGRDSPLASSHSSIPSSPHRLVSCQKEPSVSIFSTKKPKMRAKVNLSFSSLDLSSQLPIGIEESEESDDQTHSIVRKSKAKKDSFITNILSEAKNSLMLKSSHSPVFSLSSIPSFALFKYADLYIPPLIRIHSLPSSKLLAERCINNINIIVTNIIKRKGRSKVAYKTKKLWRDKKYQGYIGKNKKHHFERHPDSVDEFKGADDLEYLSSCCMLSKKLATCYSALSFVVLNKIRIPVKELRGENIRILKYPPYLLYSPSCLSAARCGIAIIFVIDSIYRFLSSFEGIIDELIVKSCVCLEKSMKLVGKVKEKKKKEIIAQKEEKEKEIIRIPPDSSLCHCIPAFVSLEAALSHKVKYILRSILKPPKYHTLSEFSDDLKS
ncbi:hypothetical protein ADUPG1_007176, partial [Aduncisulcus paluster]